METVPAIFIGIGLSAACGFRIFVPIMGLSIAALTGYLTLSSGFEWIGTWPALIAFSTATILEVCAYYIPWVDNIMDTLTTPAALVAGTIAVASTVGDVSPFLKWSMAIIAGGGVAGIVQGGTVASRAVSSGTTGGIANPVVSTMELVGAILITILAIFLPILCLIVIILICYKMIRNITRSS